MILMLGLFLVLLTSAVINVDSDAFGNLTEQTSENHKPNSSSGCVSVHDDGCEDEQIHQITSNSIFAEPVIFITLHKNSDLIFHPFLTPWEPPRV